MINVAAFIALVVACVLFVVSALRVRPLALVDLGLAALTLGLILQFATKSHTLGF